VSYVKCLGGTSTVAILQLPNLTILILYNLRTRALDNMERIPNLSCKTKDQGEDADKACIRVQHYRKYKQKSVYICAEETSLRIGEEHDVYSFLRSAPQPNRSSTVQPELEIL
jgi:hypothetical protein